MPPDRRAPLSPPQAAFAVRNFPVQLLVQPSGHRCFSDEEYRRLGLSLTEELDPCQVLLGLKEVPEELLIPGKTYCMFSHTIKKQPYNRDLLRAILKKKIRLIDYEAITDDRGRRVIAFGRFAGMVGAHNALYTYGRRTGLFSLPRLFDCHDYAEAVSIYRQLDLPPVRIVLTGTGRVGAGAAQVLRDMGIRQINPSDYLSRSFDEPIFTQLRTRDYVVRRDGAPFTAEDYHREPGEFTSVFAPFYRSSDIMINGIYWDSRAPAFFSREEMRHPDYRISVIADVTCDIAPVSSIPATLRPTTIEDPVFGYDPESGTETEPHREGCIDMMTIDNLPSELPRDASESFGKQFIQHVLSEFLKADSDMLKRATVATDGQLGPHFGYLRDYVEGKE